MTEQSKKVTKVRQVADKEVLAKVKGDLPEVPGLVFMWQNPFTCEKSGWGIWAPVTRDSELGEKVAAVMGDLFDKFAGLNAQTNYFQKGRDSMLAYASKEAYDARMDAKRERADAQLRKVETADGAELRHTYINSRPHK